MITLILFFGCIILTTVLNFWLQHFNILYLSLVVLFSVAMCIVLDGFIATIICKFIPEKAYIKENFLFKVPKCERKFYNIIKVKKWKDHTLELGFLNGFRKNKIVSPNDNTYIQKFIIECNRGYLTHLIAIFICVPLIFVAPQNLRLTVIMPIVITNAIINYMSVAILRNNVYKLYRIYEKNERKNPQK